MSKDDIYHTDAIINDLMALRFQLVRMQGMLDDTMQRHFEKWMSYDSENSE